MIACYALIAWNTTRDARPPESVSSPRRTMMSTGNGCFDPSSPAEVPPDTLPGPPRKVSTPSAAFRSRRPRNGGPAAIDDAAIGERDGLLRLPPVGRAPVMAHRNLMGGTRRVSAARGQQGQIEQLQAAPRGIHHLHPLALGPGIT